MCSVAAASDLRESSRWADLPWLAGTAVIYTLVGKIVLAYCAATGAAVLFWPGAGVALAAVLLGGHRFAGAVFVGAFAAALWNGEPAGAAAFVALASAFESLLGAWLLSVKGPFDASLRTPAAFFRLAFFAALVSPCLAALAGAAALNHAGGELVPAIAHWWMADALGILVVAPLVLVWRQPPASGLHRIPETAAVLAISFLVGQLIFFDWLRDSFGPLNRGYWMFLLVAWAAVRLGRHGVLLVVLLTVCQAFAGSALGLGLFRNDMAMTGFTNCWAWTATLAGVGLSLAIVFSERERIAAQLRSSEYRLRVAKGAAGLGIFDHDIGGDRLRWDERMRELWGIGLDEPTTSAMFLAGMHPEDRAAAEAAMSNSLAGRGSSQAAYRVIGRDDGRIRHVAANWKVLYEDGRPVRVIGTVRDVSTHKRLKQEIQERRSEMELFSKQQVAAQTAAAIAHELNQPLVSVAAYSEAALRMLRAGNKSPDKLLRALEGSMEQAQRAGRTLHELLDFLHRGEASVQPLDIGEVVREAVAMAEESGCRHFLPTVELDPGLPAVMANRLQVQKVLVNLLHNGAEAMAGEGIAEPSIAIKARALPERGLIQVTVHDQGPGFRGEVAQRIFEPFFTTKADGVGLGLAISRSLIEAHGGKLWADADAAAGATFHFTLPCAP